MDAKFFETFEEMIGHVPMSRDPEGVRFQQVPASMPQAAQGFAPGSRAQAV